MQIKAVKEQLYNKRSRSTLETIKIRFSRGEQAAVHIPETYQKAHEGNILNLAFHGRVGIETGLQRTVRRADTESRDFNMVPWFMQWIFRIVKT